MGRQNPSLVIMAEGMGSRFGGLKLDRLPEGIALPEGRTKPWGTGHALACCKGAVNGPFAVINADDFYGRTAFSEIYDFLAAQTDESCYADSNEMQA